MRTRLVAAAVGALALTLLSGCGDAGGGEPGEAPTAPPYSVLRLDGDSVSLRSLEGEVVLLNVWATWCIPCRREIPELQALHEAHADEGLHVVGVTIDGRGAEEAVRAFIREMGMTYDIWWDPDQVAIPTFDAVGVPLTVLIDRAGRIAWRHLGAFERGDPELLAAVERTLGAASPGDRSTGS